MARVELGDGCARVVLDGVVLLHPEDAVFEAMLVGWGRQQRGGRRLQKATVDARTTMVRRFFEFADEYPWRWTAGHVDEWTAHLACENGAAASSIRKYQGALRMFCDYITSPYYQWPEECETRFGTHPVQICHEWNTAVHREEYESSPDRRPMTREEIQELLDYADAQVEQKIRLGRKGALTAYRDATIFKVLYGWGLRIGEASMLDVVDFYRNPKAPEFGGLGKMHVRFGKSQGGSPPKRRTVLSVMPWAVESLDDYLANIRPRFKAAEIRAAVWLTERGGRLRTREIDDRFAQYRDAIGLDPVLVPHCLRHSYVTHLVEDGADPKFVQEQVGHAYASTTALYTGVSGDFMNTMMRPVIDGYLNVDEHRGRTGT